MRGLGYALDCPSRVRQELGMVLKDAHGGQQNETWKEKGKKKKKWKEGLGAGGTWRHEGQIGDGQSDAR